MDQKSIVPKLPDFIDVERHGDVLSLSWTKGGSPDPQSVIVTATLIAVSFLLSFGGFLASIPIGWKWMFVACLSFSGLVAFFMVVAALRWFSVESIELRPDSLTHVFRGPLAPKPREFRRSEIVDIRVSRNSDSDDPILRLIHRGLFMNRQKFIGLDLQPEHLQMLETYLRDWFSGPGERANNDPSAIDLRA
jgi:hypothetical protein